MKMQASPREQAAGCLLLFGFLVALTPGLRGFTGDMWYWQTWAKYNAAHGVANAYSAGSNNYTPLFQYPLWLFGTVLGSPEAIDRYIGYIRVFPLLADFWALYLVYRWTKQRSAYLLLLVFSFLNIGYSYNTLIWGQVDAIPAAFAFAAFYALHRERPTLSGVLMVLAVNMKLQAIIFVPLWGLLALAYAVRTRRWQELLWTLLAMAGIQVLLLLPFLLGGHGLRPVIDNALGLVGSLSAVSLNAHNLWYLLLPHAAGMTMIEVDDKQLYLAGLTYRQVGLLLFGLASLAAFFPLMRHLFRRRGMVPPPREMVWLTAALLSLLFFFLNTEMHERYSHPAAIFLTAYAFYTRRWMLYVAFSVAYCLNLERVMRWFALPNYDTFLFDQRLTAVLFGLVIAGLFYQLYRMPEDGMLAASRQA